MKLSLIVAVAQNNVIGRNNELPWYLPQDLQYFKSVTLGKPIIMGRKTFESIGKPLPGRTNIVVTRQSNWQFSGVLVAQSVHEAIRIAEQFCAEQNQRAEEVRVIGGAEIYSHALAIADRVYLTNIDIRVDGDAFFPELSVTEWQKISEMPGDASANLRHSFSIYERKVI
jgi:dihydrofolate reductase